MFALGEMEFCDRNVLSEEQVVSHYEDFHRALAVHGLTFEQYLDWWDAYHKQWHVRLRKAYRWIRRIPNRVEELLIKMGVIRLPF
jgi:hypothetical protein